MQVRPPISNQNEETPRMLPKTYKAYASAKHSAIRLMCVDTDGLVCFYN